jgi:hypothetical protein
MDPCILKIDSHRVISSTPRPVKQREKSRDSSVGIVTRIRVEHWKNRGSIPSMARYFSLIRNFHWFWGLNSLQFYGQRRLFCQDKNGRGAKLTTPSSADVKNKWRYTSILNI